MIWINKIFTGFNLIDRKILKTLILKNFVFYNLKKVLTINLKLKGKIKSY